MPSQRPDCPVSDPHKTLRVPKTATMNEIRASWKRLIVQTHPDKAGGDEAGFRKVQNAYEWLCAEAKKTPQQKRKDTQQKAQGQRRKAYEKRRAEEKAAADAMFAEQRADRAKQEAARMEAAERRRVEEEQKERRILLEGRGRFEERMAHERHEAYLQRCREFEQRHEAKRKAYVEEQGRTVADRMNDRANERLQSRYMKYSAAAKHHQQASPASPASAAKSASPAISAGEQQTGGGDGEEEEAAAEVVEASTERAEGGQRAEGEEGEASEAVEEVEEAKQQVDRAAAQAFFWECRRAEAMRALHEIGNFLPTVTGFNSPERLLGARNALFER